LQKNIIYARILSHKEGDNMKGVRQKETLSKINQLLTTTTIPDTELKGSHIDHTTDMNKFHVSIVFNEKCVQKIIEMRNKTSNELVEYGTFFYGRIKGNTLLIENYLSDFERADSEFVDAAVNVSERNISEKELLTEYSELNQNPYNVVVHFHTHPAYGITKNHEVIKPNTTRYSDQDLYSYGYLQKYHQPKTNNFILFIGGLLAADVNRTQISAVYYDEFRKDFFNINNIYYYYHGELFKFNNYDIEQSRKIEDTSGVKIMKGLKDND